MLKILLVIGGIWLLCGLIACWRDYHGYLKYWHESLNESYWSNPRHNKKLFVIQACFYFIMLWFGPIALYTMERDNTVNKGCWWYTTKKK